MGTALDTADNVRGPVRHSGLTLKSWLVGGALFTLTPGAHAQEAQGTTQPPRYAPHGAVRVLVATEEPGLLLTVSAPGWRGVSSSDSGSPERRPIISCYRHCELWAFPGDYALRATNAQQHIDYELTLHVEEESAFEVSSGSTGERVAGMVTGIVGPIAVVVGALLVLDGASKAGCDACSADATEVSGGFALGLFGLLATPVGWIIFAKNQPHAALEEEDSAVRAPSVRLGVQALPRGGWGLGLSTQF